MSRPGDISVGYFKRGVFLKTSGRRAATATVLHSQNCDWQTGFFAAVELPGHLHAIDISEPVPMLGFFL